MSETRKLPELVVTKDGIPFEDQAEGIRQFKEACRIASLNAGREPPPTDCISMPFDVLEQIGAEITSLRAQLDEAKEAVKFASESVAGLARTAADLRSELDEARRKAIEQCAAIAKTYGGDCDLMISEFRALLSESKT